MGVRQVRDAACFERRLASIRLPNFYPMEILDYIA